MSSVYEERRAWADSFIAEQRQVATGILLTKNLISVIFTPPTYAEDAISGIDDYIDFTRLKVAYRVRKFSDYSYWRDGFTLRTSKKYGYPSELEKVMQQGASYADWLLYSVADEHEPGKIMASILIDLKSVGAQLKAYPQILNDAQRNNQFVDLSYSAFPENIIGGMH